MAVLSQTASSSLQANGQAGLGQTNKRNDPEAFIKKMIAENDIVTFSKSYCPFCRKTKDTLDEILRSRADGDKVSQALIELDQLGEEGSKIQQTLLQITGQRTVPNVFVTGQHVGGNDMVQVWAGQGRIDELLNNLN